MNDDPLKHLTAALADENDGSHPAPQVTRARIQRLLVEKQKKRRSWLVFGVPLFVVFAGSSAWAATHGGLSSLDALVDLFEGADSKSVEPLVPLASRGDSTNPSASTATSPATTSDTLGTTSDKLGAATSPSSARPNSTATSSPAAPTSDARAAASSGSTGASLTAPPLAPPTNSSSANAPPRTSAAPSITSTSQIGSSNGDDASAVGLAIYKRAHAAQFHDANCAAALPDYDEYLRVAPRGAFVLEARYNSAVCLARLGRATEARRALTPFANGSNGNYRATEARALLDALESLPR